MTASDGHGRRGSTPERDELDRVARLLIAEWERVEGRPVNVSYVTTFVDMARVVIADRATRVERTVGSEATAPREDLPPRLAVEQCSRCGRPESPTCCDAPPSDAPRVTATVRGLIEPSVIDGCARAGWYAQQTLVADSNWNWGILRDSERESHRDSVGGILAGGRIPDLDGPSARLFHDVVWATATALAASTFASASFAVLGTCPGAVTGVHAPSCAVLRPPIGTVDTVDPYGELGARPTAISPKEATVIGAVGRTWDDERDGIRSASVVFQLREEDRRMTPGPWRDRREDDETRESHEVIDGEGFPVPSGSRADAAGIARLRNDAGKIADLIESAATEIGRLGAEVDRLSLVESQLEVMHVKHLRRGRLLDRALAALEAASAAHRALQDFPWETSESDDGEGESPT